MNDVVMGNLTRFAVVDFLHKKERIPFSDAERLFKHVAVCDKCHMTLPEAEGSLLTLEIVEDLVGLSGPCCRRTSATAGLDLHDAAVTAALSRWLDDACVNGFANESQRVRVRLARKSKDSSSSTLVTGDRKKGRSRKVPTDFHRPPKKTQLKLVRPT